ncbi:unnamed protein product [Phytophthora fragariaefolia]|uniref:Unnamed protein product n=1 Tax=Phytophthora fragariaefolia TaxID=1490495 RepID=A0A9W7CIH1_9STRA|nr:unnamed protein product [Phytophthora fragariaefolia]
MEKIENRPPAERRVEGISKPHYGGSLGESLGLFLDQARLFFEANNIDYTHEDNRKRVLAIMVSSLTGQAAAWYITQHHEITDITALCRKRSGQRGPSRQPPHQQQSYQRQRDVRTPDGNDAVVTAPNYRVNFYEEKEPAVETELFERLTINAAGIKSSATQIQELRTHQLLVKEGKVNAIPVKILLDSGTDHNVVHKSLATQVVRRKKAIAKRFDGSVTNAQWVNEVKAEIPLEGGYRLKGMIFSEWDLPASHDVILGKLWFSCFNPTINWRSHEVILDCDLLDPYWVIEDHERFFAMAEAAEAAGLTTCSPVSDEGRRSWRRGRLGCGKGDAGWQ